MHSWWQAQAGVCAAASPVTMPTFRLRSAQKLVPIMPTKMTLTGSHTRTTPQLKGSTCRRRRGQAQGGDQRARGGAVLQKLQRQGLQRMDDCVACSRLAQHSLCP